MANVRLRPKLQYNTTTSQVTLIATFLRESVVWCYQLPSQLLFLGFLLHPFFSCTVCPVLPYPGLLCLALVSCLVINTNCSICNAFWWYPQNFWTGTTITERIQIDDCIFSQSQSSSFTSNQLLQWRTFTLHEVVWSEVLHLWQVRYFKQTVISKLLSICNNTCAWSQMKILDYSKIPHSWFHQWAFCNPQR